MPSSQTYFGKPIKPWKSIKPWKYHDWMGWHEQGDGKLFLGISVEQGRIKDVGDVKLKTLVRKLSVDHGLTQILSPTQSLLYKDIPPEMKGTIDSLLAEHGVKAVETIDPLTRLSMACPALPTCGLAVTEAERRMPDFVIKVRAALTKHGLDQDDIILRMTGCPNGCARPYMAELALVGDGPDMYQIWVGGAPDLTRLGKVYADKVKWVNIDRLLDVLIGQWKESRFEGEALGDYCARVGVDNLLPRPRNFSEVA